MFMRILWWCFREKKSTNFNEFWKRKKNREPVEYHALLAISWWSVTTAAPAQIVTTDKHCNWIVLRKGYHTLISISWDAWTRSLVESSPWSISQDACVACVPNFAWIKSGQQEDTRTFWRSALLRANFSFQLPAPMQSKSSSHSATLLCMKWLITTKIPLMSWHGHSKSISQQD